MKRILPLKPHILALLLAFILHFHTISAQVPDSEAAMTNIHRRLSTPSRRTYSQPLLFVGVIEAFGPIFMGVCKEGVDEYVDFRVENVILGTSRGAELRAGYINCTRKPLPAPPFTLRGGVIVYCEQSHPLKCLTPVEFSEQRLARIKSWANRPAASITPAGRQQ